MRIVVPYTLLTKGCSDCLDAHAPHAERVYVGDDPTDYWQLLRRVWADGRSFILIEHDIEFSGECIEVLEECSSPFCTVAGYFRLTKFDAELMERTPDVFATRPVSERHWVPLEWYAREAICEQAGVCLHNHIRHDWSNPTRGLNGTEPAGLYTTAQRWPVWAEWLRSLPPEAADRHTAKAWAEHRAKTGEDGSACHLVSCLRATGSPYASICDRCRGDLQRILGDS